MKEITIEDIKAWKKKLAESGIVSRKTTFNLPQGHIGNGVYRIADGVLTGKLGWDTFQKELMRQAGATIKNKNNES